MGKAQRHLFRRNKSLSRYIQTSAQSTINPTKKITTRIKTKLDKELIPSYLEETYWWAYTHPNAVWFWERQALVDAILWGNFNCLKQSAINEVHSLPHSNTLNVSQIACVYGNFSMDLVSAIDGIEKCQKCVYNIIDIAPVQLENTKRKMSDLCHGNADTDIEIGLYQMNSANMELLSDASEDITFLFFLLHEQPKDVRLKTIEESIRTTKENGKIVIVDYHRPLSKYNPFLYIMRPILTYLEPFAIDLWKEEIGEYVQALNERNEWNVTTTTKELYFGGLYQKVVLTK